MKIKYLSLLVSLLFIQATHSQEWKNYRTFKKQTGGLILKEGCWLKKDRIRNTKTWKAANSFNLSQENGNLKYTSISIIRDFYLWFDDEIKQKGHEINGVGIAAIAAKQLSNVDNFFIRCLIIRNKEVVSFANEGSLKVIEFVFPLMSSIYFSDEIFKNESARNWDLKYGEMEQCEILDPLYQKLSNKALNRLQKMAKGKGVFNLAVPNELKFKGDIKNCETRFEHGENVLFPYYLKHRN
ncbi:hypothetical protein [Lutibacter sp.]|uniref:hypothetical protein n=1 Tax=Lutibacter sp. TaxID=1925666 RepID=UPI001A3404AE|nr:hypothetical protein [Lutibacter sp.]MBI9040452.1 hypothetical protein [Lutibacter sp.]